MEIMSWEEGVVSTYNSVEVDVGPNLSTGASRSVCGLWWARRGGARAVAAAESTTMFLRGVWAGSMSRTDRYCV